jgi:hypothetical protein
MGARLATFVHISDLHFGDIDPNTGDIIQDTKPSRIMASISCFDGLLGHSNKALARFEKFFTQIRQDENAQLIITGDLTCVGKPEQFSTADEYLRDKLLPPKGNYLGLSVTDWKARTVPGNHDQWPGNKTIFGGPTSAFTTNFPTLPFVSSPLQFAGGQQLQFIGINTDADVSPIGWKRMMARGSFCSQLVTAAQLMGVPDKMTIRVLLLHHSRAHQGRTLRIESASCKALDAFIVEQDISVLLSGHTHAPHVKPFRTTHQGRTIEALEARCGTTLQTDVIPFDWKTIFGNRPNRELLLNTLLVHRLLEEDGKIIWRTETYTRTPFGFEKKGPEDQVRVWPRS